jgi:hypothetical protein
LHGRDDIVEGSGVAWWEKPKKRWTRKKIAALALVVVLGGVLVYWFVVDPLIHYEDLVFANYEPYFWVANAKGQVTLVELNFANDGAKAATVDKFFVNGTVVNASDIAYYGGPTASAYPNGGLNMLVFPENFVFQRGANYSFDVQTASGRHFIFTVPVDEARTMQENLTIVKWSFSFWPPDSIVDSIYVWVQNAPRFDLITKAWVNGTEAPLGWQWIWSGHNDGFGINYDFGNSAYEVRFRTACGNTYEFLGHGYESGP